MSVGWGGLSKNLVKPWAYQMLPLALALIKTKITIFSTHVYVAK